MKNGTGPCRFLFTLWNHKGKTKREKIANKSEKVDLSVT